MNYFYVYILKCNNNAYYIGHTDNIETRLYQHKYECYSKYTSKRLPVELVFTQTFQTRDEAFAAERKLKGWSRAKKEALINGQWQLLQEDLAL